MQCTLREIASFFGCTEKTIETHVKREYHLNFYEVFAQKRIQGFISLHRQIWQSALGGQPALLIFLAKQYLGMSDKVEVVTPQQPGTCPETMDLSRLTDEQLEQLEHLVNSASPDSTAAATAVSLAPSKPQKDRGPSEAPIERIRPVNPSSSI